MKRNFCYIMACLPAGVKRRRAPACRNVMKAGYVT